MIKDLENAIGYHFHNISLLQNALTHSSYANERWHNSLSVWSFWETVFWVCWWQSISTEPSRTVLRETSLGCVRIWSVKRPWPVLPTTSAWAST